MDGPGESHDSMRQRWERRGLPGRRVLSPRGKALSPVFGYSKDSASNFQNRGSPGKRAGSFLLRKVEARSDDASRVLLPSVAC